MQDSNPDVRRPLTWIVFYLLVTAQITRIVTAIGLIKLLLTYT
jgi:hypothetical protein